jgi:hypothetical protein
MCRRLQRLNHCACRRHREPLHITHYSSIWGWRQKNAAARRAAAALDCVHYPVAATRRPDRACHRRRSRTRDIRSVNIVREIALLSVFDTLLVYRRRHVPKFQLRFLAAPGNGMSSNGSGPKQLQTAGRFRCSQDTALHADSAPPPAAARCCGWQRRAGRRSHPVDGRFSGPVRRTIRLSCESGHGRRCGTMCGSGRAAATARRAEATAPCTTRTHSYCWH